MNKNKIRVGDFYLSCGYHPCLCTEADKYEVSGVSLVDGSSPHTCSYFSCNPKKLTALNAVRIRLFGPSGRRRKHAEHPEISKMCGNPWWTEHKYQYAFSSTRSYNNLRKKS